MTTRPPFLPPFPRRLLSLALGAALLTLGSAPASAQVDELQLRLARQLELPWRWDNVEDGRPYWLGGNRPEIDVDRRNWQVTTLAPGERLSLRLPAGERLRLLRADGQPLRPEEVVLRLSGGSGAAQRITPLPGDDGLSLVAEGYPGYAGAVHVECPADAAQPLRLAAFVSRRMFFQDLAPYRRVHALPLPVRTMRRDTDGGSQDFWQLKAGEVVEMAVQGPTRLAIQGRLLYPPRDASLLQGWWLRAGIAGQTLAELQFETASDSAMPVLVDGRETPVTRQQEGYVEIPPGEHRLRLVGNGDFLLRVLELDDPDYLLPALNEPDWPARAARDEEASPLLRLSGWGQASEQTVAALLAEDDPASVHRAGLRLLQDNRRREGSMLAAAAMQEAALRRRDQSVLQQDANAFLELHTYYRDLLPEYLLVGESPRFAWYLTPRLLDIGERGRGTVAAAQHEDNLLAWMDSGMFIALPQRGEGGKAAAAVPGELSVHFDTDAHLLRDAERARLRALATSLASGRGRLEITGHTDSRASDAYNQALSRRRAEAVAAFLVAQGIAPARLHLAAHAARQAVADNSSEAGRQANRRVSVRYVDEVPATRPTAHVYPLPERFSPSWLRVALHADDAAVNEKIYLQFDDAPPQEFSVEPSPEFAADNFQPSAGETALLLQRWQHGEFGGSTLSAAFSKNLQPARLIPAGINDIPLPSGVRQVRAWRASPGGEGRQVWLALKVRMAKPYALSERGVLAMLGDQAKAGTKDEGKAEEGTVGLAALQAALIQAAPGHADLDLRGLDSHLQALARVLRSEHRSLSANLADSETRPLTPVPEAAQAAQRAQALASTGQWLASLEQWNIAATQDDPQRGLLAEKGRILALLALGENNLAEQRLKAWLIQAPSAARRRWAAEELARLYRQNDDEDALLTLAAAAFVRDPQAENLQKLVPALLAANLPELALTAGVLLPAGERPPALLPAALHAQWWSLFDRLVEALPDPGERLFWQAQAAARQGKFDAAGELFRQAAAAGQAQADEYGRHLARGLAIHRRLPASGQPDPATLADWAEWLATHPGARSWQDSPLAITGFAGSASIRSVDREAVFMMHRAEPGAPLRLGFYGPTRLRLEARPIHPAGSGELLEGWLQLREGGERPGLQAFPITQNPPADGLQIIGAPDQLPGRRVLAEIPFGPGWHELEIDGGRLPLLLRAQFAEASLRLPVLPLLNRDSLQRPQASELPPTAKDIFGCRQCTVLIPEGEGEVRRFHPDREMLANNPARLGGTQPRPEPPGLSAPGPQALAAGDWDRIIQAPWPAERQALVRHLASLLWIAEQAPERYAEVLARGSALVAAHPQIAELQPLNERLLRRAGWVALGSVTQSAGQRSRLTAGWEPENPAMRVRRALLPPTGADEFLVSGSNRLVLSVFNPVPARFRLQLRNEDVSGLKPQALRVSLEIDGKAQGNRELAAAAERLEKLSLGSGEHSIRLGIIGPVAGQFLRLRLSEEGAAQPGRQVLAATERFYHVATRKEPLHLQLPGPVWLRIDEWRDGQTQSSYRLLPQPWNELTLPAGPGGESLYRLFTLGWQGDQPVTPPRRLISEPEAVAPPPVSLPARPVAQAVALHDGLALGGQEDGTPSITLSRQQRSYGQADNPGKNAPGGLENFSELAASYRYFDAEGRAWYRGDLLGRWREAGGPTLGARAFVRHAPIWSSWNFAAQGSLFIQSPEAGQLAYAANWRGSLQQRRDLTPKLYHLPEFALFLRQGSGNLASSQAQAYRQGKIDQDVFTPYLDQHRVGGEVSDQLVYQPWLDNQLYARAGVVSNQDFNFARPDHLAFSAGIRQLFGQSWGELRYGQNQYFADADRRAAQTSRKLSFRFAGEIWRTALQRVELGFTVSRDITDRHTLIGLTLSWHGGNGRAFSDFMPGEIDFQELRTRRMPPTDNNRISDILRRDGRE